MLITLLLVFQSKNFEEAVSLLLIGTPLLGDALTCVLRRFFAKQNPFKAHKVHLYQRLVSGGLSHRKVSLIYIICTFLSSLVFLLFGDKIFNYLCNYFNIYRLLFGSEDCKTIL